MELDLLIQELQRIDAIKLGEFTLKSGVVSPIYIDLRQIVSYPTILHAVAQKIWEKIQHLSFESLCGVPYTALPIATCISLNQNIPMLIYRKEAKDYGTKKRVEGVFKPGQACVIIEDVVTSAGSVIQTADDLRDQGITVTDVVVFVDREQGGKENLAAKAYHLHTVTTLSHIMHQLRVL